MKTIDVSDPAWKLLGELEWTFSAHTEDIISTRLEEILEPLDLPADFRTRLSNSTQETIARIIESNSAILGVGCIHLLFLITPNQSLKGKTWGFFHIEKMDGIGKDHPRDHSIEFYLYIETP